MIITGTYPHLRLRRSRKFEWSRKLIQENNVRAVYADSWKSVEGNVFGLLTSYKI